MKYILFILTNFNFPQEHIKITAILVTILLFILFLYFIWYFFYALSKAYINSKYFKLKNTKWGHALKEANIFSVIGYVVAGLIANFVSGVFFPEEYVHLQHVANKIINIYFLICIVLATNKILTIIQIVHDANREIPIKGFIQFIKIFINFFSFLIILAYTVGKQPTFFISSLGIIASVLMIVFKDTIVGLTAGWQLSMNKMIKLGDWIEMPQHNADGEVFDISLTTVYVKNWDRTIVTIPAYDLISNSFLNWRDIQESGLRRIKRSFNIDTQSIKFVDKNLLQKLSKLELLKDYIDFKEDDIAKYNKEHNIEATMYNGRYLTNIGLFRVYCQQYIKTRPLIDSNSLTLVRQLTPTSSGLPLEVYCFTKVYRLEEFELCQADIFDHLLSVIKEFDLFVFQNPSGNDILKLK